MLFVLILVFVRCRKQLLSVSALRASPFGVLAFALASAIR
ncbi:hypothetical protein BCAR13_1010006 [Paraburkholderia caribensis]|nr:hypothetical protein BCAR13_1010006 [Paraburkholderia caribensis]